MEQQGKWHESQEKWWSERGYTERPRKTDERDDYQRDYARIIHSAAFRRLQGKTQILGIGESDFSRTRLTHSLEVAQISRGIRLHLKKLADQTTDDKRSRWCPQEPLIEAVALAHDIGHPPFGHGGEIALNYMMRDYGGFEGNGQTLRLLSQLETHTHGYGLNLTRRVLLGLVKYPVPYRKVVRTTKNDQAQTLRQIRSDRWKPPKCILDTEDPEDSRKRSVLQWLLYPFSKKDKDEFVKLLRGASETENGKAKYRSLDASIVALADDIAYGVHDLEDGIKLRLISDKDFDEKIRSKFNQKWAEEKELYSFGKLVDMLCRHDDNERKIAIGALVHAFIVSVEWDCYCHFDDNLLDLNADLKGPAADFLNELKELVVRKVIKTPEVQTLEYCGQQIVMELFEAIASDPERLMTEKFVDRWKEAKADGLEMQMRVVCDYIAGMSDEYATKLYERLFVPRQGSVIAKM